MSNGPIRYVLSAIIARCWSLENKQPDPEQRKTTVETEAIGLQTSRNSQTKTSHTLKTGRRGEESRNILVKPRCTLQVSAPYWCQRTTVSASVHSNPLAISHLSCSHQNFRATYLATRTQRSLSFTDQCWETGGFIASQLFDGTAPYTGTNYSMHIVGGQ